MDYTMPAVYSGDDTESEEQRKQRLIREAGGMSANRMPPVTVGPGSAPERRIESPSSMTMPPVTAEPETRANASTGGREMHPGTREYDLALGATNQPRMPAVRFEDVKAPELEMPAAVAGANPSRELAEGALASASRVSPPEPSSRNTNPLEVPESMRGAPSASGSGAASTMPPAFFAGAEARPHQPTAAGQPGPGNPNVMPAVSVGPREKAYEDYAAQGRPGSAERPLPFWKRALDIASQVSPIGRVIERNIPGSPGNYDAELARRAMLATREQATGREQQSQEAAAAKAQFDTPEKRRAYMAQHPDEFGGVSDFEKNDWVLAGKFPQHEPAAPKDTDKKIDEYVNAEGKRVLTFQRADGSTYDHVGGAAQNRQSGHTSPFEAFAYGSPDEKKAAQDFLAFERRLGRENERPTEAEFRYSLYKRDPETYKAIFGEPKGNRPDTGTATRMLNYFDRRRRDIEHDFTLDDNQKQEQLREIENLERPFMDAVQSGAAGGGGGDTDTSGGKAVNTAEILDYARKNGISSVEARKHFKDQGYRIVPVTPAMAGGKDTDRVNVISPQGVEGTIPRSQLGAAKKKGYREAQ